MVRDLPTGVVTLMFTDVEGLDETGRRELVAWLRHHGPVGHLVTRHSRETPKRYRQLRLLEQPIADRDVEPFLVPLATDEQELYDDLDALVDRLLAANVRGRRLRISPEATQRAAAQSAEPPGSS